ncbi:hypothetical protein BDW42DRAFT_177684 [Aspergillus taichungensis]|uniref:Uncharacterized protein n=1 Tax=Aspergillus taichungensis TaxID=482145 RepID=A0A2J5HIY1_9EURO|nr:hypothetical protein BDW42DRAFT_177684 [Aspergillus taichungensis]
MIGFNPTNVVELLYGCVFLFCGFIVIGWCGAARAGQFIISVCLSPFFHATALMVLRGAMLCTYLLTYLLTLPG